MLKAADQRLEGQVVDADGKPVANSQVQLTGAEQFPQTTNTDANGHFIFNSVSDGRVAVYADNPNIIRGPSSSWGWCGSPRGRFECGGEV
jgi:protocatechuate 3,4-dioxygenase beta subunit